MDVKIQDVMSKYEDRLLVLIRENVLLSAEKTALEEYAQSLQNQIADLTKQQALPKEKKHDAK